MKCPECDCEMTIVNHNGKECWDCNCCGYMFLVNQEEAYDDNR
jgi:ribosomal protein L37AE/L43A